MSTTLHFTTRSATGLIAFTGVMGLLSGVDIAQGAPGDGDELPATIEVIGVVRDFRERTDPDGHPDFEKRPDHGYARYSGNIAPTIGEDRKPVFAGGGHKVAEQWRDSEHRQICYRLYDPALGDTEGTDDLVRAP